MQPSGVTPTPFSDPDVRWLLGQHERDLEALARAADRIAELKERCVRAEERCARYASDQTALIVESRRAERNS